MCDVGEKNVEVFDGCVQVDNSVVSPASPPMAQLLHASAIEHNQALYTMVMAVVVHCSNQLK